MHAFCRLEAGSLSFDDDVVHSSIDAPVMNRPADNEIQQLLDLYRKRDLEAAERSARRCTRKWPDLEAGWNILSATLHARGKLDKAAEAYQRAIALCPDSPELHESYAALRLQQGRAAEAVALFAESARLNPESSKAHGNLAMALLMNQAHQEAAEQGRRAVSLDPRDASARNTLGNALKALGDTAQAIQCYRKAVELDPGYAKAHYNLANALVEGGSVDEAENHYALAIRARPDYAKAHCALGSLLAKAGRFEEAERAYRNALSIQEDLVQAHRYLAWLKTFTEADADLARIEKLAGRRSLPDDDRAQLYYAAGKAHADIGSDPDRAFACYARGAELKRAGFDYDVERDEQLFSRIAAAHPHPDAAAGRQESSARPVPVFIVGMPRSGTTLVEQIIAAHSKACPMGESGALPRQVDILDRKFGATYPRWIDGLGAADLESLREGYFRSFVQSLGEDTGIFTDKMMDNFKYLGLIVRAMPEARIIHVMRSPLDTCLSCFTQYFSTSVPYSYDLSELGRYYRAYHALMEHWRRVLPGDRILDMEYEALTREPARQARRMIGHCGLEWEEACLDFGQVQRLIETASVVQARRSITSDSVGRWKKYEKHLKPLIAELGGLAC